MQNRFLNVHLLSLWILVFIYVTAPSRSLARDSIEQSFHEDIVGIFARPDLSLATAKLTIDKLIDPSIDSEAELANIDAMVATIEEMAGPGAGAMAKMATIQRFIYAPGPWNDYRPFAYDHADPLGEKITNKMLTTYMETRLGNCVSMPFLVLVLADELGLDATASTAPLHVFVKFTDEHGRKFNLEATSGLNPARDAWYEQNMPMTEAARANGVYMKELSRTETLAVMATTVVEHLIYVGDYENAIAVSDVILAHYPEHAFVWTKKGTAIYYLIKEQFYDPYPRPEDVPPELAGQFMFFQQMNESAFARADALGWRPAE
ncbi:MAG: transglutaminase family protein [Parvularculaceae bacterium]